MAPLILLVEMLRFYAFRVKVFLGIATVESLRYRDELAATFGEKPRDAYIYVDDLLAAGVKPADLFVACDRRPPTQVRGIPAGNLHHGLLPDQYRRFLAQTTERRSVTAFTCGPNRMMEIVGGIAAEAGVSLKVLLEKRMGCGIGVCFSCVCRVRRPAGEVEYARVCKEGPLFDVKDIVWNETDLKPNSAGCGCAARC
jgi:dihydroorotate dehydrogenase electron transfer subunit